MDKPLSLRERVVIAIRSAGVGVVATAIDLGALALLVSGLGIDARIASVPALCLGIVAQFRFCLFNRSNSILARSSNATSSNLRSL